MHHRRWLHEVDGAKRDALRYEGYTLLEFDVDDTAGGLQRLRELL